MTLLLLLVPGGVAAGFDANRRPEPGDIRIAILQPHPSPVAEETMVQTKVVRHLAGELKSRGFDAYETSWTFDDAMRAESVDVDYFVEVAGAGAASADVAGIGIGGRRA
ncbi:MAG TPA: hypothetical protein VFO89_00825, partial [Thermoanaerobaculia bacterium]|nr:hypothetical protein [Thermoanaerobaculia bacterium]